MNKRRYVVAAIVTVAGFSALFMVLPSQGAGTEVRMQGNRYLPDTVRLAEGGAITFVNKDDVTHTASCQGEGCPKDSGDVHPGQIKTITFPRGGPFVMFCAYHGQAGMTARVTVGG